MGSLELEQDVLGIVVILITAPADSIPPFLTSHPNQQLINERPFRITTHNIPIQAKSQKT